MSLEDEARGALIQSDGVVVVRRPIEGVLTRHAGEPAQADEAHQAHECPRSTNEPGAIGQRRGVAATSPRKGEDDEYDRGADRDDYDAHSAPVGVLEDDAVDDAGEIERCAGHRDRGEAPERAHLLAGRPSDDPATDDFVAGIEHRGLTWRDKRRRTQVEPCLVASHGHRRGKWDAAVAQDDVRRELC